MNFWLLLIVVVALGVLLCFLLAIANHSGERFMDEYKEMNNIPARTKLTPLDFVDYIIKKYIKVNGKNLTIGKMDTQKEELTILGDIESISYLSIKSKQEKKEGIFTKLFK